MLLLKIMATPVHTYLTPVFIYFAAPGLWLRHAGSLIFAVACGTS